MTKPRYRLSMVLDSVAEDLAQGSDHSATTIRCAINDRLDYAEREGYAVSHDYAQERAVAGVKRRLKVS